MSTKPLEREINRALYGNGKSRQNLETQLVLSVIEWINTIPFCRAWRHNVGAMEYLRDSTGKRGFVRFGNPGESDVIGICHGIFLSVELKQPGKKPTALQAEWLQFVNEHGGIAFYADSFKSTQQKMRHEFETRNWTWNPKWETA